MNTSQYWYKSAIFYELYVRAFKDSNADGWGDLKGVTEKLDYLQDLGVDAVWLLPISPSPLRDDGYDVSDYYGILPQYGNMDNFRELVNLAHERCLKMIVELVPNHTSDQHPWFQASRDPNHPEHEKYKDYYVWSDTNQRYKEARIIFLDTEKSNWTFDPVRKQFYWHRFFSHQPDLNYDNPEVQREMLRVVQFWIDQGVDGIRVDAPPYLFEREGTNCENLPETHAFLKRLRAFVDAYAPGTMLLSEANQWPEDVIQYFGNGDEMHMNFHFPLMPRLYMALAKADRTPIVEILARTPQLPEICQWGTFLRCHDELTLEMVTPEERQWMWETYAPEPRMRLNLGIRRRLAPLMDNDQRKILLMHSLLLTMGGSPFLYYGDEIGMGDNIWLEDRNGLRTPMQWDDSLNAGFSSAPPEKLYAPVISDDIYGYAQVNVAALRADPNSLLNRVRHMLAIRKQHPVFGWGTFDWEDTGNNAIAAYRRKTEEENLLIFNNLADQTFNLSLPADFLGAEDALTGEKFTSAQFKLEPYRFIWLRQSS
ncbi:MAG TPA: maltose alpha-D-glucosyltransferase [Anaerolineaceae bacterium]|nr:maltose alpha-D-glucosyltransferase [Anaerolineaceae bacterium]